MGNCPTPELPEENSDEEVRRCDSDRCTSVQAVVGSNYNSKYNKERDAFISNKQVWKNKIVPYELNSSLNFNKHRIVKAMRTIENFSRLRFVERSYQDDAYLEITIDNGCYYREGNGFSQPRVSLGIGCEDFGTVLHELMHAIGFEHEQKRPDRDEYITIHWENIKTGAERQFKKLKKSEYFWSEFPFDYNSIMMYDEYAFSKNRLKTIEAHNGKPIHRKTNLSEIDKVKLQSL